MNGEPPKIERPAEKKGPNWIRRGFFGFLAMICLLAFIDLGRMCTRLPEVALRKTSERESETRRALPITAGQLLAEYNSNEIRADSAFKGKVVAVSGYVSAVGKDILGHAYVTLNSGESQFVNVQCMLRSDAIERAATLNPGVTVTLTGRVEGKMMNVLVEDCSF